MFYLGFRVRVRCTQILHPFCSCCLDVLEFALGSYLFHDHVLKYDDASEDALYQVQELTAPVESSFGISDTTFAHTVRYTRKP